MCVVCVCVCMCVCVYVCVCVHTCLQNVCFTEYDLCTNKTKELHPHKLTSWCLTSEPLPPGFCKQQLWPLFHYILPGSPGSSQRFNVEFWQAYVKANKVRVCSPRLASTFLFSGSNMCCIAPAMVSEHSVSFPVLCLLLQICLLCCCRCCVCS